MAKLISASLAAFLRYQLTGESTPGVTVATQSVWAASRRGYTKAEPRGVLPLGMVRVTDAGRAALEAFDAAQHTTTGGKS